MIDPTILVVDDEPNNLEIIKRILVRDGYSTVVTTTDPREAVALWHELRPDMLILDLMMPHLDGFEVMERIDATRSTTHGNYVPIVVLTADASRETRNRALESGANDFLTKPLDHDEVRLRIRNLLETRALHLRVMTTNRTLEERVRERTQELEGSLRKLETLHEELHLSRQETIRRLSMATELRDDDTGRHIVRMGRYAGILAEAIGLERARAADLELATQMHDVGKIGIPDEILLKPSSLTLEERSAMERHPQIGYEILAGSTSELLDLAARIALSHHERIDGRGYPYGLSGTAIPLEARIAAVADVFDALTSDRVYRPAMPLERAIAIVRDGRGTQFSPEIVDCFTEVVDDLVRARDEIEAEVIAV